MSRRRGATLASLFTPSSIAVVGASNDARKAGAQALASLARFPGRLIPVHPRETEVGGLPAVASLAQLDEPVDLAVLTLPAPAVPAALESCAAAGTRAALVVAGGFAEAGSAGATLQAEVADIVARSGMRLLGPNTSGFVVPHASVHASFVPAVGELRPGPVAVVAQSGGMMHATAFGLHERGVGVRLAVGLGNAVDVGPADVLDHLVDDPGTGVVALAVEGVTEGRRLVEAVARTTPRRPVVALVVGRADVAELARSHTGALATDRRLAVAALAQAGAVVVETLSDLLDVCAVLSAVRLPPVDLLAGRRPGVGVVTGQAGPGLHLVDELRHRGVDVPPFAEATRLRLAALLPGLTYLANPADTGRPSPAFGEVVATVAADPGIDVVVVYALHEPAALDPPAVLGGRRPTLDVPLIFATDGPPSEVEDVAGSLRELGIPVVRGPDRAARAVAGLVEDARRRPSSTGPSGTPTPPPHPRDLLLPEVLDEPSLKAFLAGRGVAVPRGRVCASRREAHRALAALGPPVVVKVVDAALPHKSDHRGVHLGVRDGAALDAALEAIDAIPGGIRPYLVEEEVAPGVELTVGVRRDPTFGPVVLLAVGGVAVEALGDVALRLAPLRPERAAEMVEDLVARPLLDGFRGLPAVDRSALGRLLADLGDVLVAVPGLAELEINPLRATADGLVALDALAALLPSGPPS